MLGITTHFHCISDAHEMYLQIMLLFVISPLFVFVFALLFLMLCCAGKYSTAGAGCASHARTNYCRRSWEKLNSGHTFEFRPKNWATSRNWPLRSPQICNFLFDDDNGLLFETWEERVWRETLDGCGGWSVGADRWVGWWEWEGGL